MKFAAVSYTRERTGEGWATTSPVHSKQGRLPTQILNNTARLLSVGARRHPTNVKEAVNGNRAVGPAPCIWDRNSPQPSHYFSGDIANVLELAEPLPPAQLGSATVQKPSALPFSFKIVDPAHLVSPARVLAKPSMEKNVSCVRQQDLGSLSEADLSEARKIHERLLVRLMVSPGDSRGAMHRAEQAYGLSYWCQHNLRYQNRASGEFIARLHAVWLTVLEQSVHRDVAELLAEREKREVA